MHSISQQALFTYRKYRSCVYYTTNRTTIPSYLRRHPHQDWYNRHHYHRCIKSDLPKKNLIFVSNDSVKNNLGSGAWICSSEEIFPTHSYGSIPCPGTNDDIDSHRAKLIGILGALHHFHQLLDMGSTTG
jgi:hypothetical protein